METLAELLKALVKVPGAEDIAKKALAKFNEDAATTKEELDDYAKLKAEAATAKAKFAALKAERDGFKRDLDAGAGSKDEAVKAAVAERDAAKARADKAELERDQVRRRSALADELGIVNPVRRAHATNALLAQLPADVTLDESGKLVGAAKVIKAFKESADFYWKGDGENDDAEGGDDDAKAEAAAKKIDKGNGGQRKQAEILNKSGAGKKKGETFDEKISKWDAMLYPSKKGAGESSAKH